MSDGMPFAWLAVKFMAGTIAGVEMAVPEAQLHRKFWSLSPERSPTDQSVSFGSRILARTANPIGPGCL